MNKKNIFFFTFLILLNSCSFDNKTGIWGGSEKEKKQLSELEKKQKEIIKIDKIYSTDNIFSTEELLEKKIILSSPRKNETWNSSALNNQNFLGNIYLSGIDRIFLKKKMGKSKFSLPIGITSLLSYDDNVIFSDDVGTIFNINKSGKINWKKNIYKKVFKKIYKRLTIAIHKNNIFVADNIGFIYVLNIDTGKLVWLKNHGVSIKSNIKVYDNKIFLIDQDNMIFSLDAKNGNKIWDILTISSFIKSQKLLSLAISKKGDLFAINSSADLLKINSIDGSVYWSSNTSGSLLAAGTDFFSSSNLVIINDKIIFSTDSSTFSYNEIDGSVNWENKISSIGSPIIDGKKIFIVTKNGYFVILDQITGKVISSANILKVLKKRKRDTIVTGFIMGSGKIYSVTLNGHLIVSSASSGKTLSYKKIGDPINQAPIIKNGELYILTGNSKIIGFN